MSARILIADDESAIVMAVRDELLFEGFEVESVGDGPTALEKAREVRPDVVLLDLHLGSDSGFEIAREIQSAWMSRGTSQVDSRIIFISTSDQSDFQRLIEASPAVGFIAKSFLSARAVREMLEGERQG